MRFYFEEAKAWEKKKKETFQEINDMGLPLVIVGRSSIVNPCFLDKIDVPVEYVTSNSPNVWSTVHWGKEVVSPNTIPQKYDAYNILIVVEDFYPILAEQFRRLSTPPKKIFHLEMKYEDENAADVYKARQKEIEDIYARLADQKSKDTYETMIRYRINRNPDFLSPIALPMAETYFPDVLNGKPFLHDREIFVDVGAYTGDTAEIFVKAVCGKYRHIFSWEPDEKNYSQLVKASKRMENITCWKYGAGEKQAQLCFTSKNTGSHICHTGEKTIFIETLDHLLNGIAVTYIKMDIEGMECPALRGAKNLIQAYRPKLAICTYHSHADMIDVPKTIWEINPDYQLYIRHYSNSITETVCYAV